MTSKDVKMAAAKLGSTAGKPFKQGLPSDKWLCLFKKKNNLALRTPAYRHMGIDPRRIAKFFVGLKKSSMVINKSY